LKIKATSLNNTAYRIPLKAVKIITSEVSPFGPPMYAPSILLGAANTLRMLSIKGMPKAKPESTKRPTLPKRNPKITDFDVSFFIALV
jgi:hypothetical protein